MTSKKPGHRLLKGIEKHGDILAPAFIKAVCRLKGSDFLNVKEELRRMKYPIRDLTDAMDAFRRAEKAKIAADKKGSPAERIQAMGLADRTKLFEPAMMTLMVKLWLDDQAAMRAIFDAWRAAKVSDLKAILDRIKHEAKAQEAKTAKQHAAKIMKTGSPAERIQATGLTNRAKLFEPELKAMMAALWLDDQAAMRAILDAWRGAGVANPKELAAMIKEEARELRAERSLAKASAVIYVTPLASHETDESILTAINKALPDQVFMRFGRMVRLKVAKEKILVDGAITDPGFCEIVGVSPGWLAKRLHRNGVAFVKIDEDGTVEIPPPIDALWSFINDNPEDTKLQELRRLIEVPTMARAVPGYDPTTQLFLAFPRGTFPVGPDKPTKTDAANSLARLEKPISEYRFMSTASKSVALSGLIAAVIRPAMVSCPLHAFSSKEPGAGKTMLIRMQGYVATGRAPGNLSFHKREEENEKKLASKLLIGNASVIGFDNVDDDLCGVFLRMALTDQIVDTRLLGALVNVSLPTDVLFSATGTSLRIKGDLQRRSVLCHIDGGATRKRKFTFIPDVMIKNDRAQYVYDALCVVRAWIAAGRPLPKNYRPVPSFTDYDLIRGPLLWLGRADPAETQAALFADDVDYQARSDVLKALFAAFGDQPFLSDDVVKRLQDCGPINRVISDILTMDVARDMLNEISDRHTSGLVLSAFDRTDRENVLWHIRQIDK